jgi:hypothetical protein
MIVGVTLIIVAWGLMTLLQGDEQKNSQVQGDSMQLSPEAFVETAREQLLPFNIYSSERAVLEAASKPWNTDFFHATNAAPVKVPLKESRRDNNKDIRYLAWVSIGQRSFVILNDKEYRKGDTLEDTDWILDDIRSAYVLIVDTQSGEQRILPRENMDLKGE